MATSFSSRDWSRRNSAVPRVKTLGARMTRHAAAALLVFASLQVWLMSIAIDRGASPTISIVALALLLAVAIPFARRIERNWVRISEYGLPSPALTARYAREVRRLWLLALIVPVIWIGSAVALIPLV